MADLTEDQKYDLILSEDDHTYQPSEDIIQTECQRMRDAGEDEKFIEWWANSARNKKPSRAERIGKLKG